MSEDNWLDNSIQFPRLIAEAEAAGAFFGVVWTSMCESMDLTGGELKELIDRAQDEWEVIKQRLTGKGSHWRWSREIPTEDGYYWFWGYLWTTRGKPWKEEKPRLEQVQVRAISNGIAYIGASSFYNPKEAVGFYQKMYVPEPPTEAL